MVGETTYPMVKVENEMPKSNGLEAAALMNQGGFGNMGGMSMLLPWLFLFARGGLFGAGEAGAVNARDIAKDTYETAINQINAANAGFNDVNNNINALGLSQCNAFANTNNNIAQYAFGLERGMCNSFNQTQMQNYQNFAYLSQQLAQCCCQTQLNIERTQNALGMQIAEVNYESANRTAAIIANQNANTQQILDKLCQDQINELQLQLQNCNLTSNNAQQTQTILAAIQAAVNQFIPVIVSGVSSAVTTSLAKT